MQANYFIGQENLISYIKLNAVEESKKIYKAIKDRQNGHNICTVTKNLFLESGHDNA
jgi:hypothetical protein